VHCWNEALGLGAVYSPVVCVWWVHIRGVDFRCGCSCFGERLGVWELALFVLSWHRV
jgi:hypothetical protein